MSRIELNTAAIADGQVTTPDIASGAVTAGKIANPLASLTVNNLTAGGLTFPTSDGANGHVLTTDGNGSLSFSSGGSSASGVNADGDLTAANVTITDTLTIADGTGGNITGANSVTANSVIASTSFKIGSWEIKLDSNDLRFVYNGTDVCKITTAGNIIAAGDVDTNGSP